MGEWVKSDGNVAHSHNGSMMKFKIGINGNGRWKRGKGNVRLIKLDIIPDKLDIIPSR